jgi:hypothetical protein
MEKIQIRDGKTSDPGSGINIPDPQHCFERRLSHQITKHIYQSFRRFTYLTVETVEEDVEREDKEKLGEVERETRGPP